MAKKRKSKKTTKKVEKKQTKSLPDGFWRQVFSLILVVIAVLMIFGSFNGGGNLAIELFKLGRRSVGMLAYLLPALLIAAAALKVRGDEHKLPRATFFGLIAFIASLAGLFHLSAAEGQSIATAEAGNGGGLLGHMVLSVLMPMLSKVTAGIVLFLLAVIALHFIFKWPLTSVLKLTGLAQRPKRERPEGEPEADPAAAAETTSPGFTLNEGVPVERSRGLSTLKNTASMLKASEQHEALTTTTDPEWKFPGLNLLINKQDKADAGDIEGNAKIIQETFGDFNINVEMQGANVGPRVTQYTLSPPAGVRLTKITALDNNLALNLAAHSIRMEAPIPGQRAVGIEVPNRKPATVRIHGIVDSPEWKSSKAPLAFSLGRDISGKAVVDDLARMPHLLVAGATGSGKSVMINTLLVSLLYRNSPADLKLILVDPKRVELTPFNDIPHLLTPVIVEPEKCISALKWAVAEMERRYQALSEVGKRNIEEYNALKKEEGMPYIVIVIDELADLMMMAARDVEALIVRIAQKARAVGIHLVLATQRPSVDVITGLIKANVPGRIAFAVNSQVDSRTILDGIGAEKLLGLGDMLFQTPDQPKPRRLQGALTEGKEVHEVTDFIRMERAPQYDDEVISQPVTLGAGAVQIGGGGDADDSLFEDAVRCVIESGKASSSLLQRRLRVGYARAARLVEMMEEKGIVGPADGARPRDVLISSLDELNGGSDSEDDFGA